ncbi:MAG: respiratory nitrate reductase subunit gamma, partial [Salinarimonas sp.]
PFTRLVHMFSVPVKYFFRPGYQVVRSKKIDARKAAPGHKVHPAE